MQTFLEWRKKHAKVAGEVVAGLLEGKEPSDAQIATLGGPDLEKAIENQKRYGKWGGEPKAFAAVTSLMVPAGGTYASRSLEGVTFHVYKYDWDKDKLQKIFEEICAEYGWTVTQDSKLWKVTKGGTNVTVTYGAPDSGGSTLVLVR